MFEDPLKEQRHDLQSETTCVCVCACVASDPALLFLGFCLLHVFLAGISLVILSTFYFFKGFSR